MEILVDPRFFFLPFNAVLILDKLFFLFYSLRAHKRGEKINEMELKEKSMKKFITFWNDLTHMYRQHRLHFVQWQLFTLVFKIFDKLSTIWMNFSIRIKLLSIILLWNIIHLFNMKFQFGWYYYNVIFSNADINKNNVSHQNALSGLAIYDGGVLYVSNIIWYNGFIFESSICR